jgi:hypothetical protein
MQNNSRLEIIVYVLDIRYLIIYVFYLETLSISQNVYRRIIEWILNNNKLEEIYTGDIVA